MAHKMSATDKALLSKRNLLLMIDEADLLTPGNRDAMSRVLQIVRGDARPNGGAQVFEVGDPMQGAPYLSVREKNDCIPGRQELGARKEVTLYTYLHVLAFLEVHTDARCVASGVGAFIKLERLRVVRLLILLLCCFHQEQVLLTLHKRDPLKPVRA